MRIQAPLHQLEIAVDSVLKMLDEVNSSDWNFKPIEGKRSIRELSVHLSILILADINIMNGYTKEQMDEFYRTYHFMQIDEMKDNLRKGFLKIKSLFMNDSDERLNEKKQAYWGITYTRSEWLLEIMVHFYHHRAQLHYMLCAQKRDPNVQLFE